MAETNNLEQTHKELRIENASPMISNLYELNILNDNKTLNNQNPTEQNDLENDVATNSKGFINKINEEADNKLENEIDDKLNQIDDKDKTKDPLCDLEKKIAKNKESNAIEDRNEAFKIRIKNSAKTLINKKNEDSFYSHDENFNYSPNKTHNNLNNNKILIELFKNGSDKRNINQDGLEKAINKDRENDFKELEMIEKMERLEELELNADFSQKEDSIRKEETNVVEGFEPNIKSESKQGDAKLKSLNSNRTINDNDLNDELKESKLNLNKDLNNIENKILEGNVITKISSREDLNLKKDTETKKNFISSMNADNSPLIIVTQKNQSEDEFQRESKTNLINENYSKYFEASNQNFYPNAINFNNFNNNYLINSTKNVLGSDNTGYTLNVFSLTTVNNFYSNNLNNIDNSKFNQSPIVVNYKKSVEEKFKIPDKTGKEEVKQTSGFNSRDNLRIKPINRSTKKIKNKSEEKHELFFSYEEDNYKSKFLFEFILIFKPIDR